MHVSCLRLPEGALTPPWNSFPSELSEPEQKAMRKLPRLTLVLGLVVVGLTPLSGAAQAPDRPLLPRLGGICRIEDAPGPGWSTVRIQSLGLQIAYPFGWTPWEERGGVTLLDAGRTVVRISRVDTSGLEPMAWLRMRVQAKTSQQCRVVAIGTSVAYYCLNSVDGGWTTYLLAVHRVLAVDVPAALSREVHCGVLTGLVDLEEPRP